AAVALLLGRVEMPVQFADAPHLVGDVGLGGLDLLHADEVGPLRGGPLVEALALRGPDTVEVGRDDSQHGSPGTLAMRPGRSDACRWSDPEVYWHPSEDQASPCRVLRMLDERQRAAGPAALRGERPLVEGERGHGLAAGANRHAGVGAVPQVVRHGPALRPEADGRRP